MRVTVPGLVLLLALPVLADRRAADDELLRGLRSAHTRVAGERVIVWAPAAWTEEKRKANVANLDDVVVRVERLLGKKFAAEVYEQTEIEYFISADDATPSHVYAGYDHDPSNDPAYVFLSGLESGEAPHIHETAHIVGGPFGSLLLREGLATYVQFTLQPGRMRPLVKLGDVTDIASLDAAVRKLLASPKAKKQTLAWLDKPARLVAFESRPQRGVFYAVSASFVAFLVSEIGMETFMRVYAADDVRAAIENETGKSWGSWTDAWLDKLGQEKQAGG